MKPSKPQTIVTVFGNPIEPEDSLAVRLVPKVKKRFPEVDFQIADPTESLEPPGDPWIILDVAVGIEDVVVIENLHDLDHVKGSSVHDYDVYLDLRLKEKLGQLPRIRLVLIPADWPRERIDAVALRLAGVISTQK